MSAHLAAGGIVVAIVGILLEFWSLHTLFQPVLLAAPFIFGLGAAMAATGTGLRNPLPLLAVFGAGTAIFLSWSLPLIHL